MTENEQHAAAQVAMAYLQVERARRSARLAWVLNGVLTLWLILYGR